MRLYYERKIAELFKLVEDLRNALTLIGAGSGIGAAFRKEIDVTALGLKGDGVFRNEQKFADALERLPKGITYVFPDPNAVYLFGPLSEKYNNLVINGDNNKVELNERTCINLGASGAHIKGEGTTVIQFMAGAVGLAMNAGISPNPQYFSDICFHGPGAGADNDGKDSNGNYSMEFGPYHGIVVSASNQAYFTNCKIRHATGHNVRVFGFTNMYALGIAIEFTGTLRQSTRDPQYWEFIVENNSYPLDKIKIGYQAELYGLTADPTEVIKTLIPFNSDIFGAANTIYLNPNTSLKQISGIRMLVRARGGPLIADCGVFQDCDSDFAGGSGYYIQGNDANQWIIRGGTVREPGQWGIADLSFLGTGVDGTHITGCGKNFRRPGGRDDDTPIGPYITLFSTARSVYNFVYTEGGNQGKAYLGDNTISVGGLQEAGYTGPGLRIEGPTMNRLAVAGLLFDSNGMKMPRTNDSQPWTFRMFSTSNPKGTPTMGYTDITQLSFPRESDALNEGQGMSRADSPFSGVQTFTLYIGNRLDTNSFTLKYFLETALRSRPVYIGDAVTLFTGNDGLAIRYLATKGGDINTAQLQPQVYGMGSERPAVTRLGRHDIGWPYYIPNKGIGWFDGTNWVHKTDLDVEITDVTKGVVMTVGTARVRARISGTVNNRTWTFDEL